MRNVALSLILVVPLYFYYSSPELVEEPLFENVSFESVIDTRVNDWLVHFPVDDTVVAKFFLGGILEEAIRDEILYGIPVEVKVAQAALETGWGRYVKGNNWFGIKGKSQSFVTTEFLSNSEYNKVKSKVISKEKVGNKWKVRMIDNFAAYESLEHSSREHTNYLLTRKHWETGKPLYAHLVGKHWSEWTKYLQGTYATSTTYTKQLNFIIKHYNLEQL